VPLGAKVGLSDSAGLCGDNEGALDPAAGLWGDDEGFGVGAVLGLLVCWH
jgi:hypothetical protein